MTTTIATNAFFFDPNAGWGETWKSIHLSNTKKIEGDQVAADTIFNNRLSKVKTIAITFGALTAGILLLALVAGVVAATILFPPVGALAIVLAVLKAVSLLAIAAPPCILGGQAIHKLAIAKESYHLGNEYDAQPENL